MATHACCLLRALLPFNYKEIIFRKPILSTRQMTLLIATSSKMLKFCQKWNFQSIWTALIAGIGFNKAGMGWAWVVLSWYLMYLNTLYLILHTPNPIKIFHVSHLPRFWPVMEIVIDKKGKIGQLTSTTQPVDAGKSCSLLAKMSENEEIYTTGKNFTLPQCHRQWREWQISSLQSPKPNTFSESWVLKDSVGTGPEKFSSWKFLVTGRW